MPDLFPTLPSDTTPSIPGLTDNTIAPPGVTSEEVTNQIENLRRQQADVVNSISRNIASNFDRIQQAETAKALAEASANQATAAVSAAAASSLPENAGIDSAALSKTPVIAKISSGMSPLDASGPNATPEHARAQLVASIQSAIQLATQMAVIEANIFTVSTVATALGPVASKVPGLGSVISKLKSLATAGLAKGQALSKQ